MVNKHFVVFIMVQACSKLLRHIQQYFVLYSKGVYKLYTFERDFRKDSWEHVTSVSTDKLNKYLFYPQIVSSEASKIF